jgi:4-aminobutyrate aminotransferase-like enzyme
VVPNDGLSAPTLAAFTVFRAQKPALVLYHAGNWSNVLELAPPSVITREEIDRGVTILA